MKIFREEFFGGILYDDASLNYNLVKKDNIKNITYDKFINLPCRPERTDILIAPVRIYFELTGRCNLACRLCFAESHPGGEIGMPKDLIFRLLEDMKKSGVINVRFTGGEPTSREDWYEILHYAKELGLVIALSSNGVFHNIDETVEKIKSLEPEQVTFSIDGMRETHDYIRGNGTFDKMVTALEKLKKKNVNLRLTTILTEMNINEIPEIVEFASRYVKIINFVFMRVMGRAKENKNLSLTYKKHHETAGIITELQKKYPHLLIFHSAKTLPKDFLRPEASSGLSFASAYANTSLNVAYDGTIWPHHYAAHQEPSLMLGKYTEDSLLQIWTKSEKLDKFRNWTKALQDRCLSCGEYGRRCSGFNFEMELAKQKGEVEENFYCINNTEIVAEF